MTKLMDLPDFLMHGNLYHAQRLSMYSAGLLPKPPTWKQSLFEFAGRMTAKNKLSDPVKKVVRYLVEGKDRIYPGTTYSVTEQVFDCWWDVVYGPETKCPWQTQSNEKVNEALAAYKKTPQHVLTLK